MIQSHFRYGKDGLLESCSSTLPFYPIWTCPNGTLWASKSLPASHQHSSDVFVEPSLFDSSTFIVVAQAWSWPKEICLCSPFFALDLSRPSKWSNNALARLPQQWMDVGVEPLSVSSSESSTLTAQEVRVPAETWTNRPVRRCKYWQCCESAISRFDYDL